MSVYKGADTTYAATPEPTRVELWTTDDGRHWGPLDPEHPVAHVGGTETDIVESPGGGWIAVTRKEAPRVGAATSAAPMSPVPGLAHARAPDQARLAAAVPPRRSRPAHRPSPTRVRRQYDLGWRRLSPPRRTKAYQLLYG